MRKKEKFPALPQNHLFTYNESRTDDLVQVLIDAATIERRVDEIASEINRDYRNVSDPLILVGILKGSFIFLSDLSRKLRIPHVIDFIAISSYGNQGTEQGNVRMLQGTEQGNVRMLMDTRENMSGRDVLIVEDIIDSGKTLDYLQRNFATRGAKSVRIATFLDKKERHKTDIKLDYMGFEIPDVWVVGYGLDYKEKYRTLPYIAEMHPVK